MVVLKKLEKEALCTKKRGKGREILEKNRDG